MMMKNNTHPAFTGSKVYTGLFVILFSFFWGLHCKKLDLPVVTRVTVTGIVQLPSNYPLSGVKVSINNQQSVVTGANGYFQFKDITLDEGRVAILAEHANCFTTSKTILVKNGGVYNTRINLAFKNQALYFENNTGFNNTINQVKFEMPPNALQHPDGSPYAGTCRIAVQHIRADDADIARKMPGMLVGKNEQGEERCLASFGMVGVELETSDGTPLEIIPGQQVTMSVPIAAAQLPNAPDQIPLWHFNTASGIWEQEGMAEKKGDYYEGKVGHFSFWNYDLPFDAITLKGRILVDGQPVQGASFTIKTLDNQAVCSGDYLGFNGDLEGLVPVNQVLTLTVYDICNGFIAEQTIGPFANDTDMGAITVNNSSSDMLHLKAKLLDCSGNPVPYGMFICNAVPDDGNSVLFSSISDENGLFELMTYCAEPNGTLYIRFYDAAHSETSTFITLQPTSLEVDLGEVRVCGNGIEGYRFENNGIPYGQSNIDMQATVNGPTLTIAGYDSIQQEVLFLKVANNGATGTFPAVERCTGWPFAGMNSPSDPDNLQVTVTIEQLGDAPGKPVRGTFYGTFKGLNGETQGFANGTFYALRQE